MPERLPEQRFERLLPPAEYRPRFSKELQPNGREVLTIRVRRPQVNWRDLRDVQNVKRDVGSWDIEGVPATVAIEGGAYDYEKMMGDVGSPESIEMPDPSLSVAFVRHLKHKENVVSAEDKEAYETRAEELINGLQISPDDEVYVIASPSGQFMASGISAEEKPRIGAGQEGGNDGDYGMAKEGVLTQIEKQSRTGDTASVIKRVLERRGLKYRENIDSDDGTFGPVDIALAKALQEFRVVDDKTYDEAAQAIRENMTAEKEDKETPHPESPKVPSTVYASHAPDVQDLIAKTGITEMSSATVARTLQGLDRLEEELLSKKRAGRAVVIIAGHGQFGTNITEALQAATNNEFPIVFAGNGDYFHINAARDKEGRVVEEYKFTRKAS